MGEVAGRQQQQSGQLELIIQHVFSDPKIPNEVHVSVVREGESEPLTLPLNPSEYGQSALREGNRIVAIPAGSRGVVHIEAIYSGQRQVYPAASATR